MTQILEAVSIVKSFGAIQVLEDVSVTVNKGEIVGLLGPNGAGKTTLVNIIAGYESQNSGTVSMDGRSLDGLTPEARTRAGLARTFQSGRLLATESPAADVLTFDDSVQLGCALHACMHMHALHSERPAERGGGSLCRSLSLSLSLFRERILRLTFP